MQQKNSSFKEHEEKLKNTHLIRKETFTLWMQAEAGRVNIPHAWTAFHSNECTNQFLSLTLRQGVSNLSDTTQMQESI